MVALRQWDSKNAGLDENRSCFEGQLTQARKKQPALDALRTTVGGQRTIAYPDQRTRRWQNSERIPTGYGWRMLAVSHHRGGWTAIICVVWNGQP
jgi:hypothetical protein